MKKSLTRVLLACLLVLTVVFACGCSNTPDPSSHKILPHLIGRSRSMRAMERLCCRKWKLLTENLWQCPN